MCGGGGGCRGGRGAQRAKFKEIKLHEDFKHTKKEKQRNEWRQNKYHSERERERERDRDRQTETEREREKVNTCHVPSPFHQGTRQNWLP